LVAAWVLTASLAAAPSGAVAVERLLADSGTKATTAGPVPVDREAAEMAQQLVQSHLPELEQVLGRLAANRPREHDRAIRDLAKSARRLEAARDRDERLYELEVELLKAQTQVSLLTAKLKVRDSQSDRKLLREAAGRLQQAQLARSQYEVDVLRARLQRTQQQLDAAQQRLDDRREELDHQLEESYLGLLRKAGRDANKN
jgi:hypothetical protein